MNTGFTLLISAKTGIGVGTRRAASKSARPAARDPVNPTAVVEGWRTSAMPMTLPAPWSIEKTPAGNPHDCTARATAPATSSDVPGWPLWAFTMTGIARGERGRRVAAGHGKREWKVARAENHDRSDRHEHAPQIRFRRGLAVGNGRVDARVHPGAFARHLGEQPQLVHRARAFAGQARFRQSGLDVRARDERVADGHDFVADPFEKRRARLARGLAIGLKRLVGQPQRGIHVELGRHLERRLELRAVERTPRAKCSCSGDLSIADQAMTVK